MEFVTECLQMADSVKGTSWAAPSEWRMHVQYNSELLMG